MIGPISDQAGVDRLKSALHSMQVAYDAVPMDYDPPGVWRMWYTAISYQWDGVRGAFGEGEAPAYASVSGDGKADNDGLGALISRSGSLTARQRFALHSILHHVPVVHRDTQRKIDGFPFIRDAWLKVQEAIILFAS